MKSYILHVTILVIIFCHWSSASTMGLVQSNEVSSVKELIKRGLTNIWTWIQERGKTEDNFIGRCFGIGRKLKFIMPLIIFKLGVIITTLAFLTIFSLKSLGLLVTLLVINSSGFVAKLVAAKHDDSKHPQNVHFHVHQKKDGQYAIEPSGYDHGWYDRSSYTDSSEDTLANRLKNFNIYDKR